MCAQQKTVDSGDTQFKSLMNNNLRRIHGVNNTSTVTASHIDEPILLMLAAYAELADIFSQEKHLTLFCDLHMIAPELSRRSNMSTNGISRPNITATPAADPNSDRDPIPFGFSGSPYTQHPQPQSYVPHQIAPESFQPSLFNQQAPQASQAAQQQPVYHQPQQQPAQPQPAPKQYAAQASPESRQVSPELALAIAGVTGLSAEDCSAAIELIRDITKLLPPQHAQRVAFLLVSIAVELDHK